MITPLLSGLGSLSVALGAFYAPETLPNTPAKEYLDKLGKATSADEAAAIEHDVFDAWLSSGSPTVDLLMKRGVAAGEADDLKLARDMFDRVILIKPEFPEVYHRRSMLFFADGKYDAAINDLEKALKYEPRHFGAWIGLGMIFESIDQEAAALKAYREALKIHPFADAAKRGEKRLIPKVEGRAL